MVDVLSYSGIVGEVGRYVDTAETSNFKISQKSKRYKSEVSNRLHESKIF